MKYNCLVIEDNKIDRDLLEMYLEDINLLLVKYSCNNASEAFKILSSQKIDIVFSDIDMPGITGLELLKGLREPPVFIFITSHVEHAAESFDLDVLDFVTKPVTIERLMKSINKAIEYLDIKRKLISIEDELKIEQDFFYIKDNKGYTRINYNDICFVESYGDFSKLTTTDGQIFTALINLKNLQLQLPGFLVRVHKQYLINFNKISTVRGNEVDLGNDILLPISPSYRNDLLQLINNMTLSRNAKK